MKYYDENKMAKVRKALEKKILHWPRVAKKEMMGCLCYFRGKKFFAFLVTRGIVITKLPEDRRTALREQVGGEAFEMAGRKVSTWIQVPLKEPRDLRLILPFLKESYTASK